MSGRRFPLETPPVRGEAVLDAETSRYVLKVLRLRRGDGVTLFDGKGTEWPGTLASADRRGVRVRVGEARPAPRPGGPRVVLATAVPKGKRMSTLLAMATEAGVDAVVPVDCVRSAVRGVRSAKVEHWGRTVLAAARQCGRAWVPELGPETGFDALVARPREEGERRFLATTTGSPPPLPALLRGGEAPRALLLLVGPEGGFTAGEESAAFAAGFEPCALGPHVLRVETAAVASVALVRARFHVSPPAPKGPGEGREEE